MKARRASPPDLERAIADFEQRVSARNRGGYYAFPDFDTAYLWYKLFGRPTPQPPPDFGGEGDQEPEGEPDSETDFGPQESDIDPEGFKGASEGESEDQDEDGDSEGDGDEDSEDDTAPDETSDLDSLLERLGKYTPPTKPERPELSGWDRWGFSLKPSNSVMRRDFESWSEFVSCVADESMYAWKGTRTSHDRSRSWSGTDSFEEAVQMATQTGWPEGKRLMSEAIALVYPRPELVNATSFDVAGAFPVVPLYCARDPACMVDDAPYLRTSRPIVRIDYANSATANKSAMDLMLRGAAVLSLCDQLELDGYSVELRVAVSWDQSHSSREPAKYTRFDYSVVFKKAGEYWDLDRAAFAIANPATMRRFGFALLEQHAELKPNFGSGYGRTIYRPINDDPNTIYIPGPRAGETPDSARKAVAEAARKFLEEGIDQ